MAAIPPALRSARRSVSITSPARPSACRSRGWPRRRRRSGARRRRRREGEVAGAFARRLSDSASCAWRGGRPPRRRDNADVLNGRVCGAGESGASVVASGGVMLNRRKLMAACAFFIGIPVVRNGACPTLAQESVVATYQVDLDELLKAFPNRAHSSSPPPLLARFGEWLSGKPWRSVGAFDLAV